MPRSSGTLWADNVNKRFYLFAGEYYQEPPSPQFTLWSYDTIYDTWQSFGSPPEDDIAAVPYGAGVSMSETGEGYYYGGWKSHNTVPGWSGPPRAVSGLVKYDMDANTWSTEPGPDSIGRAEGAMVFIPIGDGGMLVYLGWSHPVRHPRPHRATNTAPADGFSNPDLRVLMTRKASIATRTPTRAVSSATGVPGANDDPLSAGAIAGIAVGGAVALLALLASLFLLIRRCRRHKYGTTTTTTTTTLLQPHFSPAGRPRGGGDDGLLGVGRASSSRRDAAAAARTGAATAER
ncbi:hypothetical protein MYCTH_94025 [Thermothelomyces thermophilus ATCC 42464]|uniref:Uncharacterized protein n=1 Tax=Thermothelomyces thermophilus (strain ATCC 42464 / BCRC 31852 / DSM 1799) TaxID=573729 RepID=G2QEG5_THET4|nr:uncharacterized protein MYCTH_94025 [Thermothelomyces thermophilus ATCC 42464]AEO57748.1 hypothetical protein MYCTH_94025 [Thermothelomyces thermophilus ATCC 42464]